MVAEFVRAPNDPGAMGEAVAQGSVRDAEKLVVIAAQCREPGDLDAHVV